MTEGAPTMRGLTRLVHQRDLWFGLFLVGIGAAGYIGASDLDAGTLTRMGPGSIPAGLSLILGVMGLILLARAAWAPAAPRLERWSWTKLALILGGIVAFALALERLGLVVAVILLVWIAGLAAPDRRWREIAALGPVVAAFAVLLFKTFLGLPLNIWPA